MTIVPVRRRVFASAPQSFGHQHCQRLDARLVFDQTEITFEPGPYHENVVGEYNIDDAWGLAYSTEAIETDLVLGYADEATGPDLFARC